MQTNSEKSQMELNNKVTGIFCKNEGLSSVITYGVFPVLLLLLCMYPINRGIDISDTMYSLSSDVLFTKAKGDWGLFMAYYLANFLGFVFTRLPFGRTMIGINFYTSLVVYGSALMVYLYFVKRKEINPVLLFISEGIAICFRWCPTTVLYNFFSYFLWIVAILLLREGLFGEKKKLRKLYLAGVMLGLAVTAKFSNMTAAILVLLVFYQALKTKEKASDLWKKVGLCVAGFVTGFGIVFGIMELVYGGGTYFNMVGYLFGMTETAMDYKATGMLDAIIGYYKQALPFVLWMFGAIAAGVLMIKVAQKMDEKKKSKPVFAKVAKVLYLCCIPVLFRLFYGRGLFGTDYQDTFAIVFVGTVITWWVIFISMWTMLSKKATLVDKSDGLLLLLLIFITPLGSNNGVYPLLNNLFLILPLGSHLFIKSIKRLQMESIRYATFTMTFGLAALSLVQGLLFYTNYTFKGQDLGQNCDTKLTNNGILIEMKTNQERAVSLQETLEEASGIMDSMQDKKLLTYGNTPGFFFLLEDSVPVLSTTWPDLDSFGITYMKQELASLEDACAGGESTYPLIILTKEVSEEMSSPECTEKEELLKEFMKVLEYDMMFENEKFEIWY